MTAAVQTSQPIPGSSPSEIVIRGLRRNAWGIVLLITFGALLAFTFAIEPGYAAADFESLIRGALPLAFAAAGQAVAVIAGGIDLSIGSLIALTNVVAAKLMMDMGNELSVGVILIVLLVGLAAGALNGALVVFTRVPDIVVTLAMLFVWQGAALMVLRTQGGRAADWFKDLGVGPVLIDWVPRALVIMIVIVAVIWIPLRRSRLGMSLYAVGSDPVAALRSGVDITRTKIVAYAVTGLFAAFGGLALTMSTGIGAPVANPSNLLIGVAAVVLGGVSLAGGRGGLLGPLVAAFILGLIRWDLVFMGVDPNWSVVVQGIIMVIVVTVGGFVTMRRSRA
jgi:ribose transport system permease protein